MLQLDDGVRFFVDNTLGGNNQEELRRLRDTVESDAANLERDISRLPETQSDILDRILSSKRALLSLLEDPDIIWESATLAVFRETGKYNCLRITRETEDVVLDVIKPGIHKSCMIKLAEHMSPELRATLRAQLLENSPKWEKKLPEGFLPEGVTEHNADSIFDEKGGTRLGAVFVADRILDLGVIKGNQKAILHWKVKHTNPDKEGGAFKVEDTLNFEWESLPTH